MRISLPDPALTVTISLPPEQLSPNAKIGSSRRSKQDVVKTYREESGWAFKEALLTEGVILHRGTSYESVTILPVFYFSTRHRRDTGNAMAMLKPAIDGAVDAGLIKDDGYDHLVELPPIFRLDKVAPRVEFRVYDFRIEFIEEES